MNEEVIYLEQEHADSRPRRSAVAESFMRHLKRMPNPPEDATVKVLEMWFRAHYGSGSAA